MRTLWFKTIFFCVLVDTQTTLAARLEDLDRIQDQAPSFEAFLSNKSLVAAYLRTAQAYAGGSAKFPVKSYEAILEMMRKMTQGNPLLAERLWSKEPLGPTFSIRGEAQTTVTFNQIEFQRFLEGVNTQASRSTSWIRWWSAANWAQLFINDVTVAESDLENTFGDRQPNELEIQDVVQKYRSVIAGLLLYQLQEEADTRSGLRSSHWEVVSQTLSKLEKGNLKWGRYFQQTPKIFGYIKHAFPELTSRGRRSVFLVEEDRAVEKSITFRASRPFHAVFRGLLVGECNAGDWEQLDTLTARRFALPLMRGELWMHFVEEKDVATGHVQAIPISRYKGPKVMSVDLLAGVLLQKWGSAFVYELWLEEATRHLPKDVIGFSMGESKAFNNEKVQEFVYSHPSYLFGRLIGPASEYLVPDAEVAYLISALSWRLEKEHGSYDNVLVFDGQDRDAGTLRLLGPQRSQDTDEMRLREYWKNKDINKADVLRFASRQLQKELAREDRSTFRWVVHQGFGFPIDITEAYINALTTNTRPTGVQLRRLRNFNLPFVARGLGEMARWKYEFPEIPDLRRADPTEIKDLKKESGEYLKSYFEWYAQFLLNTNPVRTFDEFIQFVKNQKFPNDFRKTIVTELFKHLQRPSDLPGFSPEKVSAVAVDEHLSPNWIAKFLKSHSPVWTCRGI